MASDLFLVSGHWSSSDLKELQRTDYLIYAKPAKH